MSLLLIHAIYHPTGGRDLCHSPNAHRTVFSPPICFFYLNNYHTKQAMFKKLQTKMLYASSMTMLFHDPTASLLFCFSGLLIIHGVIGSEHHPSRKKSWHAEQPWRFKIFCSFLLNNKMCFRAQYEPAVRNKPWLSISLPRYHYFSSFQLIMKAW